MIRLSRRQLARHGAQALMDGKTEVIDQLAAYLVETRRTKEAGLLVRDIEKALADNGLLYARVHSARALDEAEQSAIQQLLSSRYGAKEVELSTSVEPSLLGGVVVTTASDEYDGSLKRSLTRLKALNI